MHNNDDIKNTANFLKQVSIFSDSAEEALEKIAKYLEIKHVLKEETVFKKGDKGHALFIIARGKVRIHDNGHVLGRLGPGEVFGEYSLVDYETRSASVTAEEHATLYKLEQEVFYELMARDINVMQGVLKVLIKRMRYMNELENKLSQSYLKIQDQKKKIESQNKNIKAQKKELEKANEKLQQANDQKNYLIEIIAHDLKNPLASSICVSDILGNQDKELTPDQKESVEVLQNSLKKMNNIVNQILDVHGLRTKNLTLKFSAINLATLIKEILDNFEYAISKKELHVDFNQKNTFAHLDENHAKLVFENLIYNFIRYAPDFGHLSIDLREDEQKAYAILQDDSNLSREQNFKKLYGIYQKPQPDNDKKPDASESVVVKYIETMDGKITCPQNNSKGFQLKITFNKPVDKN
ncbi:MAG: cyclic nucleotide-binding domain-containing protein [Bacteroidales bacterium]|nr:cyclic nucleotide-binding domain-containing protein [Bacteroidales bacterium]MCF8332881.1 cyclic nucleotide-binding domain-containing protein [Bacteroidales bacterium]